MFQYGSSRCGCCIIDTTGKSVRSICGLASLARYSAPANSRVRKEQFHEPAQAACARSPSIAKNFTFVFRKYVIVSPRLALTRRGVRVVTNVGCGMRWTLSASPTRDARSVRQRRVVLVPRCWDQVSRIVCEATGANKPGTPGRARHKPSHHCAGKAGSLRLNL